MGWESDATSTACPATRGVQVYPVVMDICWCNAILAKRVRSIAITVYNNVFCIKPLVSFV